MSNPKQRRNGIAPTTEEEELMLVPEDSTNNDLNDLDLEGPNGILKAASLLGGLTSLISSGLDNINSVNGDIQYNNLKSLNFNYGLGDTNALLNAYNSRPNIKTDYTYKDVGGKNFGLIMLGSFDDSVKGFTAGSAFGPWGAAIGAILGGVEGLATGAAGRFKADSIARDLNFRGGLALDLSLTSLANSVNSSKRLNMNVARNGGRLNTHGVDWSNGLTYFNTGGSHEENPMGGILQGFDLLGKPNTVELGEVRFNDIIYSKKLTLDKKYQEDNDLNKKYIDMSFAKIAEDLGRESEERPNDPISKRTLEDNMMRVASALDQKNIDRVKLKLKGGIENLNQEDLMYLALAIQESQIPQEGPGHIIGDEEALQMQDNQRQFAKGGWLDLLEATPGLLSASLVISDAAGWTNKNDFSPYESFRLNVSRVNNVSATPIGGYQAYNNRPDINYMANALRSQYANNVRSILNLAGSNRGTALTGILTNANNFKSSIGDLTMAANAQDFKNKLELAQFNTGIREKEVANSLMALRANQAKDLQLLNDWLHYGNALESIINANDAAKGDNLSNFATLMGQYARSIRAFLDRDRFAKTVGMPGAENSYYHV